MATILKIAQPQLRLEEPHNCTDNKNILSVHSALFDTLVRFNPQLRYEPALAHTWTVSDDALRWTFHLRERVKFHNGEACDAEAVKYSLERMAQPDMGATLGAPAVYYQYLKGMQVDILDPITIQITLAQPMADLLDVLVTGYILPPKATEELGDSFKETPIGSGPYEFVDFDGSQLRLKRSPTFQQYVPKYDELHWVQLPDPAERVRQVENGQIQIATALLPEAVTSSDNIHFLRTCGATVYIIMLNAAKGVLKDPRVRLALNLGIDRQVVIDEVLSGAGYPLTGFISPFHFGANNTQNALSFEPEKAKALLKQAGYEDGLTLTLDSPTSLPNESVRLSKMIAQQLGQIGVDLQVVYTEDRVAYANKVRLKEIHDMCIFDSSPLSTYRVLKEKVDSRFAGSWWQGYQNEVVEGLLDKAQVTGDEVTREGIYKACYDELCADPPWLYLYNHELITAVSPTLHDYQLPPNGVIDPKYI